MNNLIDNKQIPYFRMWCQQNFPFIEEDFDALTNYQLLCKIVEYLNTVIDSQNTTNENVTILNNNFLELKQTLEQEYKDLYDYVNNLDLQEYVNKKLDEMAENGQLQELFNQLASEKLNNFSNSNQVELSNDLLTDNTKWITDGWTGSRETGFQHLVGQTSPLIYSENFEVGKNYVLSFDVQSTSPAGAQNASNAFSVILGNSEPIITYRGGGSMHYDIGLTPKENGNLQFILCNPVDPTQESNIFDGKILNITLKEVVSTIKQIDIVDSASNTSNAFTITPSSQENTIIGKFAGINNYSQTYNTYFGSNAGRNDISGYFNVGIGFRSLWNNINGSRNVSIGYAAHNSNISGDRNVAIGPFAMSGSKTTRRSIALGYDVMFSNETGDNNIAIGGVALSGAKNSENNIAIGHSALSIPANSTLGGNNISIGNNSMYYKTSGGNCIAIGNSSQYKNASSLFTLSIGTNSLNNLSNGNNVIAIGHNQGSTLISALNSTLIGTAICTFLKNIDQSLIAGHSILTKSTMNSVTNSIICGRSIKAENDDIENVFAFGNNINIIKNNMLYLGNIIFADVSNLPYLPRVGIAVDTPTAVLHLKGGSNLPQSAPLKFEQGRLMTAPENGAFEYDGTHLYFTVGTERKQIV